MNELFHGEEVLGLWHRRHGELMLHGTLLPHVEGRLADEDGLPVLDGLHRAHAKAAPVPRAFHLVENGNLGVPWGEDAKFRRQEAQARGPSV